MSTRIAKLENVAASAPKEPRQPLTPEYLQSLTYAESLRLYQDELRRPHKPLTPKERRQWTLDIEHLKTLPTEELKRLIKEQVGDLAETKFKW